MALSLVLAVAYGLHARAQQVSYAPGVEGQIWQQLPIIGRGVDLGLNPQTGYPERPITTTTVTPTFSDPAHPTIADVWPCDTDTEGNPTLCYPSGVRGSGTSVHPDTAQSYAGQFAPCVGNQCYPSGRIGVGPAVTWAMGPCVMQDAANGVDCYPSGTVGQGIRVPAANGQFAGPIGIAVDNNPASPNAGAIFITDKWNHRVQGFRFDGSLIALQHPIGNGYIGKGPYTQVINGQTVTGELLNNPERIQIDASGQLIVPDSGNGRVVAFDTTGQLIKELQITDPDSTQFVAGLAAPTGLAITPGASFGKSGNPAGSMVVVTDQFNCGLYVFDATTLLPLAAPHRGCADVGQTPPFDAVGPEGVSLDNAGHAYVADYLGNRIAIFDAATLTIIGAFGDPTTGALPPAALSGPYDAMVDHRGVFTETDAQGTHQVARVWVADSINQRLAVFKVNFDQATPVATFLFELNAAGDLNGYPTDIAEDTSHDPVGKILATDPGNARIQRFQVPDLAVANVTTNAATSTVSFDVLVPIGKDPVGVTAVTPIVCPTSANTTVSSGTASSACSNGRALASAGTLTPGNFVTYSFQYASGLNTATFDIYATGNPSGGVPQTTSNHKTASVTAGCPTCNITPQVVLSTGALQALTPPVAPAILYVGAQTYTTQVSLRVTATSPTGLASIQYRFISGPETAFGAQPGLFTVPKSGTSATVDIPFRVEGTSTVEFWGLNANGTEIAHKQAKLTLHLVPPTLVFHFENATSANATAPNAAGWWNRAVSLPIDFSAGSKITAVTPLATGMPANPAKSSPLVFSTAGRNLGFQVTVTDPFGLTATASSNDPAIGGRPINIDLVAPSFVTNPTLTLERASYLGTPPPAGTTLTALATDPALPNGAGSGVVSVAPAVVVPPLANFPFGTTTQSFVATDAAGNTRTGNVSVVVRDTVKPVLTCPAALSINGTTLGTVFSNPGFSVSDASMINAPTGTTVVAVTQSLPITRILTLNTPTAITLTATDPSGNAGTCVTTVTAKLLTPPTFTRVPPAQTIEGGSTTVVDLNATAINAAGASVTVTSNAPAKFPLGATTVTFSATDSAGQTTTATTVITIVDTTKPVITACAAPATLFVLPPASAALPDLTGGVTATDFSTFTVTQSPLAGAAYTLAAGQDTLLVPVTLTVTDSSTAHNASTCAVTVTIKRITPPAITQASVTAATAGTSAVVTFAPTVVDLVDGTNHDPVSCTPASGSTFPVGTTSVTCSTTNTAGLTASVTFTVTVTQSTLSCTAAVASPSVLWPPNHQFALITVSGIANNGMPVTTTITSIFQDEPTQGLGDGDTPIDGLFLGGYAAVRAERSGSGNGRVYYINFTATAASGSCTGTVTVSVPHDQAHAVVGGGPLYDSTKIVGTDDCHGASDHGHHDGDGCISGHHGHYDGDECGGGRDSYHHDGDGHGGGRDGGRHR